ncbi:MAG: hypothetical protein KJ958_10545 [Gammaproteobacteria bacterium]|nr:hypothetical protein [Gammaproteobacteria bacterium]MBU1979593.1 hypothetical protein [Gammaproteobacteria bacterium]
MAIKTSTKHPYAAIDHRVLDSPAYADLMHSSCRVLMLFARQLNGKNNGQLQATFSWCKKRGIGSEHTLSDALADLIAHGLICRTRSHGANKAWARYAVCWLPITNREGLFLAGFNPNGWRDWKPAEKKSSPQKVQDQSSRKCSFNNDIPAESAGSRPAESADYELIPHRGSESGAASNELTSDGDSEIQGDDAVSSFTRTHDNQPAEYWDYELGEPRTPKAKVSATRLSAGDG